MDTGKVTDQPAPPPQRIGDAERDQAAEYLREHMAQGRLDSDEFDERLTVALTARTQADLEPLFRDLPSPRPADNVAPLHPMQSPMPRRDLVARPMPPPPARAAVTVALLSAMIWPITILLLIGSEGNLWFLMFLPFFLPWVLGQGHHRGRHRR